jgi:anti-sigma factor ChrR (cupin superfamily)
MSESLFVDGARMEWRATPCKGVRWRKLYFDPASGESAVLLQFDPGAVYDSHRHPQGEQYLVLEGDLEDGGRQYGPLTYVRHAPGSVHRPRSRGGALVFVTLQQPIETF